MNGREMSSQHDLAALLQLIVERASSLLNANMGALYLLTPDGQSLEVVAGHNLNPDLIGAILPLGEGLSGRVAQAGEPTMVDDYRRWPGRARVYEGSPFLRVLAVPLRVGDEVIGVINVTDSQRTGSFSEDEVRLVSLFADQASLAVQKAQLFEAEREQRELAEALRQATAAVSSTLDLDQMLDCILEQVDRVIPNDAVNINLLFGEDECRIVRSRGYERLGSSVDGITLSLANTTAFRTMVASGESVVLSNTGGNPDWIPMQGIEWVRSYAGAPIKARERVIGFLNVDSGTPGFYTRAHAHRLQAFADQVGLGLANAQSFAIVEQARRDWEATFNAMQDPIAVVDAGRRIQRANQAFADLVGIPADQVAGHLYDDLFPRQACPVQPCPLERVLERGEPATCTHSRGGRVFDVQATPVRAGNDDAAGPVSAIYAMRDVTREMQLEQQFRQAQKLESLGQLAGGIAHDFNNLLTVIHLSSRMLERQLRPEDPLWEHVQHIRQTGERAAKLTKQLLSFSRGEVTDPQVLSLNQAVGDLSRMLQRIIGEDIELRLKLASDPWLVKADPAQIEQVIMNMVVNARDAMPTGGTLTISTANVDLDEHYVALHVNARPGEHVLLTIGDTGEGMDDEVKSHLFEPFFTTKDRGHGTGLGLATVFGIVKQSNGHIEVESRPGKGTRFLIYLPRTSGERAVHRSGDEPADVSVSGPPPGKATILVVEDDAAVRGLATRVLRTFGYRVLEADNGARGQEILEEYGGKIDLLITDMVMPRMGGRELAEGLQRQRPGTPVLYISGYADGSLPPLPAPTSFLPKPFNVEDLLRLVHSMLGGPA